MAFILVLCAFCFMSILFFASEVVCVGCDYFRWCCTMEKDVNGEWEPTVGQKEFLSRLTTMEDMNNDSFDLFHGPPKVPIKAGNLRRVDLTPDSNRALLQQRLSRRSPSPEGHGSAARSSRPLPSPIKLPAPQHPKSLLKLELAAARKASMRVWESTVAVEQEWKVEPKKEPVFQSLAADLAAQPSRRLTAATPTRCSLYACRDDAGGDGTHRSREPGDLIGSHRGRMSQPSYQPLTDLESLHAADSHRGRGPPSYRPFAGQESFRAADSYRGHGPPSYRSFAGQESFRAVDSHRGRAPPSYRLQVGLAQLSHLPMPRAGFDSFRAGSDSHRSGALGQISHRSRAGLESFRKRLRKSLLLRQQDDASAAPHSML